MSLLYCSDNFIKPTIHKMHLFQALPCTLKLIDGSTELKSDQTMGVLVGEYNILYEAFNNMQASGKWCLI